MSNILTYLLLLLLAFAAWQSSIQVTEYGHSTGKIGVAMSNIRPAKTTNSAQQSGQKTLTLEEYLTPEHLGSALYKVMKEWHDSGVTVSPQKVVQGRAGRLQATFVKAPPRPDQPPEKE